MRHLHHSLSVVLFFVCAIRFLCEPSPALAQTGYFGSGGLEFDGSTSYVDFGAAPSLHLSSGDFTIEAWVYPYTIDSGEGYAIATHRDSTSLNMEGWTWAIDGMGGSGTDGHVLFSTENGTAALESGTQVPLNQWSHLAVTYDSQNDTLSLFLNGVIDAGLAGIASPNPSTGNMLVGQDFRDMENHFDGLIDEVVISDTLKGPADFCISAPCAPDANTLALWRFEECAGTATADSSGNGIDGTVIGSATWACECLYGPTIVVPDDFTTIAEGLAAACSTDTVLVRAGTYNESALQLSPGVVLLSEDGPALTTIDGGGNATVLIADGGLDSTAVVEGFTIVNGSGGARPNSGGGMLCINGASPKITNVFFVGNQVNQANLGYGGGIFCYGAGTNPVIRWNTFRNNRASQNGGGIGVDQGAAPLIHGNTFAHNWAAVNGGAVYVFGSSPVIFDNLMYSDSANLGAGVFMTSGSTSSIQNNTMADNVSSGFQAGTITIDDGASTPDIRNNIISGDVGAGISRTVGSGETIEYNNVFGNAAGNYFGTIADPTGTNGNISADPSYDYLCPCFAGGGLEDSLSLCFDSPSIDTGDPAFTDPDGTIGDMGAFPFRGLTPWPRYATFEDIANDQGRRGRIRFSRSAFDGASTCPESLAAVTAYSVYRRVDPLPNQGWPKVAGLPAGEWELVADTWAIAESIVTVVVPTLIDSIPGRDTVSAYSSFALVARTANPAVSYFSPMVTSGFTIDNLPPDVPGGVQAKNGPGIEVSWSPNSENDFREYAVYRGFAPDFAPSEANRVATLSERADTVWVDNAPQGGQGTHYYVVAAFDINNNRSAFSVKVSAIATDVPPVAGAGRFILHPNRPDPFNPRTVIRYEVPRDAVVQLGIVDINGREVARLVNARRTPGDHEVVWNGRDDAEREVGSGVYFVYMVADGVRMTERVTLVR